MKPLSRFLFLACILLATVPAQAQDDYLHKQAAALSMLAEHYRLLEREFGGWPEFPDGETLRPGASDVRVPVLREILSARGDYLEPHATIADSQFYDPSLQEAVQRFQARHGLSADGSIGKTTRAALNAPIAMRIRQLEQASAALQAFLDTHTLGERAVIVNIPAFTLYALENGEPVMSMKTIVGRPSRPTPTLESEVTYVQFNPNWNVPHKIATEDLLPKIQADPQFLARENYTVLEDGAPVDPATVDWATLGKRQFHYTLRQAPGDLNALGRIKFSLPGTDAIYMHSTSSPKLFGKDMRALSSGCVRVEKPRELAHFVLDADYGTQSVDQWYDGSAQRTSRVKAPVPVYFLYLTAWVDGETGMPMFFEDIYGK